MLLERTCNMELTPELEVLLAKIEQEGECHVEEADDSNVPVNIFISNDDGKWECFADNFMPRKARVDQTGYRFTAPDRETCQAVVRKFWLPLYQAAVKQLEEEGELYYWEMDGEP